MNVKLAVFATVFEQGPRENLITFFFDEKGAGKTFSDDRRAQEVN